MVGGDSCWKTTTGSGEAGGEIGGGIGGEIGGDIGGEIGGKEEDPSLFRSNLRHVVRT